MKCYGCRAYWLADSTDKFLVNLTCYSLYYKKEAAKQFEGNFQLNRLRSVILLRRQCQRITEPCRNLLSKAKKHLVGK